MPLALLVPLHHPGHALHGILTVIAARERTRRQGSHQDRHGLMPLTVPEVRRLFAKLSPTLPTTSPTGWPGPGGDADAKPAPDKATTCDEATLTIN
jgi:hypothetical protein